MMAQAFTRWFPGSQKARRLSVAGWGSAAPTSA